jgi:hypothetical protein
MTTSPTIRSLLVRAALPLALAAAAAACVSTDVGPAECRNNRAQVGRPTDGKMLAFMLRPGSIYEHYREIHAGDTLTLDWDTSKTYYGVACLRFRTTDSAHIDPSGPFQFVMSGSNAGTAWRTQGGQRDTATAYAFGNCAGDGGTYRRNADSTISLTWANGQAVWLFDPSATHRLQTDSIIQTIAELSSRADSSHASWRAQWVRAWCGE